MRKILFLTLFVSLLAIGFSSCCACRKGSPVVGNLENATWTLVEFQGKAVQNSPITLHFNAQDKMIYGTAPCNNFFAGYTLLSQENNIQIHNVGASLMMCPDMDLEGAFTRDLGTVARVKLEGDNLLLLNGEGNLVAILERAKM